MFTFLFRRNHEVMCIVGSETTPIPFWVIILSVMARFMG